MKVKGCGISDIGKKREKNEDSLLINESAGLYMVADGMGGHLGGARASKLAVEIINDIITSLSQDPDSTIQEGMAVNPGDCSSYLRYAIQVANQRIYEESLANGSLRGMGTTIVALMFNDKKLHIAHVGDSRAYLIKKDSIRQLTKDHSLVEEQVEAGILSPNDARSHRFKNIITRSVGFEDYVDVDISDMNPKPGERFLACSDGLTNLVQDEEIKEIVTHNTIEEACKRLIDVANERGGDDNITVLIAEIGETEDMKKGKIDNDDSTLTDNG